MKKLFLCFLFFVCFASFLSAISLDEPSLSISEKINYLNSVSHSEAIYLLEHSAFLQTIAIEKIEEYETVRASSPFKKSAQARFFTIVDNQKQPIADTPIIIKYPTLQEVEEKHETSSGTVINKSYNLEYATTTVTTDKSGVATFGLSAFEYPILAEVRFFLPIFAGNETEIVAAYENLTDEQREVLSIGFACKVGGKKRNNLKLAIYIVDFTNLEVPFTRNMVGTALLGEFMKRGYLWPGNYDTNVLKKYGIDLENTLTNAYKDFGGNVHDFIFGQSKVSEPVKIDGKWYCTCTAHIKIWNMKLNILSKDIVCEVSVSTPEGSTQAMTLARQKLGADVLADIIEFGFEFQ